MITVRYRLNKGNIHYFMMCILVVSSLKSYAQREQVSSDIGDVWPSSALPQKSSLQEFPILHLLDTLDIPFVEDFSTSHSISSASLVASDTFNRVSGDCLLGIHGLTFTEQVMHTDTTWEYIFNPGSGSTDSIPLIPEEILVWENMNCRWEALDTLYLWPEYFRYSYDSGGVILDSILVIGDTSLLVSPLVVNRYGADVQWQNEGVTMNTTYPILPPTIGVATFDGLNKYGAPYDKSNAESYGIADYLTSAPFNLSGLANDSNVYLSFFYQPTGRGNFPDSEDSLVVEFLNEATGQWINVWSTSGIDSVGIVPFTQVYIQLRDTNLLAGPRYFYNGFKFRFKNYSTLSGNNDHWHIDYIRLGKGRSPNSSDTLIQDVAFIEPYPSVLKHYSRMPWQHFLAAPILEDTLSIPIRDNGQIGGITAGAMPLEAYTIEDITGDTIYSLTGQNFNPTSVIRYREIYPEADYILPMNSLLDDTAHWDASIYVTPSSQNDLLSNDTLERTFVFSKELAYDDGSAERTYGIEGGDQVKKFAYRFDPAIDDSISAIRFHFSHTDIDVSDMVFNIYLWDSLELNTSNPYENAVYTLANVTPTYVDSLNGFTTFSLDSLIPFTRSMYVGWSQLDNRNLQLGFDVNSSKGRNNMFVNLSNRWESSSITLSGSPMIRLVLNDKADSIPSDLVNIVDRWTISAFPNPATEVIYINGIDQSDYSDYQYTIVSSLGQTIQRGILNHQGIDIRDVSKGSYLLLLHNMNRRNIGHCIQFIKP